MAWLQSSWHIHVPFAWLETCVEWVQEEGGGGHLAQQQINQQVLDQWLLADLRDLGHPVLPGDLSQAQKTELSGTFCVQVDSLLDISQPVYGQLQKLRGKDCANEEVTAVTQATQRPWEARPTRMLLLQVTDGVQNLEAMEYQPISALSTALRPGVKLQLQGQMVCRLGVLLLGPQNVKLLGGEVEDLVDRNNQGRVLCRALGLPEQPNGGAGEENPAAPQQANHEMDDLEDQELLASLEAQEEMDRTQGTGVRDSGYRSGTNQAYPPLSRSNSSTLSHGSHSVRPRENGFSEQGDSIPVDPPSALTSNEDEAQHFPDDFDDLPLDELDDDGIVFREGTNEPARLNVLQSRHETRGGSDASAPNSLRRPPPPLPHVPSALSGSLSGSHLDAGGSRCSRREEDHGDAHSSHSDATKRPLGRAVSKPSASSPGIAEDADILLDDGDLMDVHMDYRFPEEMDTPRAPSGGPSFQEGDLTCTGVVRGKPASSGPTGVGAAGRSAPHTTESAGHAQGPAAGSPSALSSPPFTYLRTLQAELPQPRQRHGVSVRIKAFIVTLLGKLTGVAGAWRVRATVSDGTGYLDAELSDRVLTGLLGFTVAQKGAMKREPGRRAELDAGMRRCQEEMVDMCCVMTLTFEDHGSKAVITSVDPVTEEDLGALQQRVRGRKKGM
ncbi:hypothetical protein NHX12_029194 [Muraenolepis orangiensis]|uniref:RecQ-mediated genome instability protein 1 n=1 Tax=Muraenolepis orangiensis TaxID=630683 RepID=A0A9Q0ED88_9TELE|nr:hypothetical protein NHX12_029194 [Muraenolepis orangiensis]